MICRHCKREIADVLGTLRDAQFLSFCGLGDYKHQPEMLVFGLGQIHVTPDNPADASKAAAIEMILNGSLKQGLVNKIEEELVRLKRQQLHNTGKTLCPKCGEPSDPVQFAKTQKIKVRRGGQ